VYPVQVVDPSGAGDAFAAGIIVGALEKWDVPQCLRYASALGASATRAIGTTAGVFTRAQADSFVAQTPLTVKEETWSQLE
jgi:sugar/nucleoside kinase (ribokinase family)